ncbi:hypothetical protein [Zhihengliuella salsuginis]|uniref:hypothetical protein n=1 Tax=Zhihengliuella salsuginis TaxID=578222 RepID=UPI0016726ADA|nr:hypothetical protein [Zhihengliuella salsuginis]
MTIEEQSGFYRSANFNPYPKGVREELSGGIRSLLRKYDPADLWLESFSAMRAETRGWGIEVVGSYFSEIMVRAGVREEKSSVGALRALLRGYIRVVVIEDAVNRRYPLRTAELNMNYYATRVGRILRLLDDGWTESPRDIIDLVCQATGGLCVSEEDLGELYLRLILSLVGFTGITLEWLLICHHEALGKLVDGYPSGGKGDVMRLIAETLREHPTAWRLVRTSISTTTIANKVFPAGTDFVVPTSPKAFEYGSGRLPMNWGLAFGVGESACPGRSGALDALAEIAFEVVRRGYQQESARLSRPYAASLLAPPRMAVRLG